MPRRALPVTSHRITVRALSKREISGYRNLALNPCDLMRKDDASVQFYPHASSNSVSRSLFDFEARNAIDGRSLNGHHGVWPYQSWGPQLRTDIWWKLDFGRPCAREQDSADGTRGFPARQLLEERRPGVLRRKSRSAAD